jgi:hypothetical protein
MRPQPTATAAIAISIQPHSCGKCGQRWNGLNTAHCTACHHTFTGITAFDQHRTGSHAKSTRHCLTPNTVGLVDAGRAYPCWAHQGSNTHWDNEE